MDIIFIICALVYFLIFGILCWIPGLYIEKLKYSALETYLKYYPIDSEELLNFIDALHFKDREKSLSIMYKRLCKDLCCDVRKMKK